MNRRLLTILIPDHETAEVAFWRDLSSVRSALKESLGRSSYRVVVIFHDCPRSSVGTAIAKPLRRIKSSRSTKIEADSATRDVRTGVSARKLLLGLGKFGVAAGHQFTSKALVNSRRETYNSRFWEA